MLTLILFRTVFKWIFRIILAFVSICLLWVVAYRFINPPTTLLIQSRQGEYSTSALQEWVEYDQIADNIKMAVICGEDQRFKDHMGFDFKAIEKPSNTTSKVAKRAEQVPLVNKQPKMYSSGKVVPGSEKASKYGSRCS